MITKRYKVNASMYWWYNVVFERVDTLFHSSTHRYSIIRTRFHSYFYPLYGITVFNSYIELHLCSCNINLMLFKFISYVHTSIF